MRRAPIAGSQRTGSSEALQTVAGISHAAGSSSGSMEMPIVKLDPPSTPMVYASCKRNA